MGLNGPWSDDYNYAICGIPGIICGRGPAQWSYENYHTQFDDYTIFEHEKEIITYAAKNYTEMVYAFDTLLLPPFNYKYALENLCADLKGLEEEGLQGPIDAVKQEAQQVMKLSDVLFDQIKELNAAYAKGSLSPSTVSALGAERKKLLEIYRLIQRDFMKLSPWDDVIYAHETIAGNMRAIEKALSGFTEKQPEELTAELWEVDLFKIAWQFDKEVYDWLMHCQDHTRTDLFWGTGKIHRFADLIPLTESLKQQNGQAALEELKNLLNFERQLLQDTLHEEVRVLTKIKDVIMSVKLNRFL